MTTYLVLVAIVIFACVLFRGVTGKLGIPMLFAFILLGMLFGSDGIFKIPFDDYSFAEEICTIALIFIMFYGGFGTKWSQAKPVALHAIVLSSFGTILTAGAVGVFCYFVLKFEFLESFLIGAVISSTDAASVFSILRSKHLNLRFGTASLLEIESGSNDPFSYMLTVLILALMSGEASGVGFALMIVKQLVFGVLFGVIIAFLAERFMRGLRFMSSGFDGVFLVAVAVLSFALPTLVGGNGYLSVYLTGIILGNKNINNKQALVHFFDSVTGLMQMLLFFLLGLLAFPSQLLKVILPAALIAVFLTLVARPLAVFLLSIPFKYNFKQLLVVSWSGMRGAASIVFAILTVISTAFTQNDIFHIVLFIVLFSILIQGSLIPLVAKKLDMTDDGSDVMKTFNDYTDDFPIRYIQFTIPENHSWAGKKVKEIDLPPECLLVLVLRNGKNHIPKGNTTIHSGDMLILSGRASEETIGVHLHEKIILKGDDWENKTISEIKDSSKLIVMILRANHTIIPKGNTKIHQDDILVINDIVEE
ncbi:MAG: potassium/proton antiporter [Ruminococcaceae bacterium]|nr:potassium/proton antiporter [Oscillospiraceae bacterium]